jgi:TPR repeat protein
LNKNKEDGIKVTEQDIQKESENDPETLYKFGDAYYKKKKYEKAFAWLHKAALQNQADAQAQVGNMYLREQGVSQDYKLAMDWSMKAASAGNADGQYNIGELYYYGCGVPQDDQQAMDWYLKAAKNGNAIAMDKIGDMYLNGKGATKNIPTAIEWYTKAANQGSSNAQYSLGDIYQNKDEFKDLQKAVNWYQNAADNDHLYSTFKVKGLNRRGYYAKEQDQEGILINVIFFFDLLKDN